MDWAKTTAMGHEKHSSFAIWCDLYYRFLNQWNVFKKHTFEITATYPRDQRVKYLYIWCLGLWYLGLQPLKFIWGSWSYTQVGLRDSQYILGIGKDISYTTLVTTYHKISNISGTNSQNMNVPRLGMQLSLRNIMKPGVKWRVKM